MRKRGKQGNILLDDANYFAFQKEPLSQFSHKNYFDAWTGQQTHWLHQSLGSPNLELKKCVCFFSGLKSGYILMELITQLNLTRILSSMAVFTFVLGSLILYQSIFMCHGAKKNPTCLHIIISSSLHILLYIYGSWAVIFNNLSLNREIIVWSRRTPACGCTREEVIPGANLPSQKKYVVPLMELILHLHV